MSELEALAAGYFANNGNDRMAASLKFDQLLEEDPQSIFNLVQVAFTDSQQSQAIILASHMITRYLASKYFDLAKTSLLSSHASLTLETYGVYSSQPIFGSLSCEGIVSMVQTLLSIHQSAIYQRDYVRMNLSMDTAIAIMDATRDFISYALVLQKYYQSSISQASFSGLSVLFNHKNIFRISTREDVYLCAEQCVLFLRNQALPSSTFGATAPSTQEDLMSWVQVRSDCSTALFNALTRYSGVDFSKVTGVINVTSYNPYRKLFYGYCAPTAHGPSGAPKAPYDFSFLERLYEALIYMLSLTDSNTTGYSGGMLDKLVEGILATLNLLYVVISMEEIYDIQENNERGLMQIHLERLSNILTSSLFYPFISTFTITASSFAKVLFALRRSSRPIAFFSMETVFYRYIEAVRKLTLFFHGYEEILSYQEASSLLKWDTLHSMLLDTGQLQLSLSSDYADAGSIMMKLWHKFGLNLSYLSPSSDKVREVVKHIQELCTEMFYAYLLAFLYQCINFYKEESSHMEQLVRNLNETYSKVDTETKAKATYQPGIDKDLDRIETPKSTDSECCEVAQLSSTLADAYLGRFRSFILAIAGNASFDLLDFSVHTKNMTSTYEISIMTIDSDMCDTFLSASSPLLLLRFRELVYMFTQALIKIQETITQGCFTPSDIATLQASESCFSVSASYFLFLFKVLKASSLDDKEFVITLAQTSVTLFQFIGSWLQFNFSLYGQDSPVTPYLINRPSYHLFSVMVVEFVDSMVDITSRSTNRVVFKDVAAALMNQGTLRMSSSYALATSLTEASAIEDSLNFSPSDFIAPFLFDLQFQLNLLYSSIIVSGQMRVQLEQANDQNRQGQSPNKLTEILGVVFYLDQDQPYYVIASTLIRTKFSRISEHYCTSQLFQQLVKGNMAQSSFNLAPLIYSFFIGMHNIVRNYTTIRMYYSALMSMILRDPVNKTGQTALLIVTLCNLVNLMGAPSSPRELINFHINVLQQNFMSSLSSFPTIKVLESPNGAEAVNSMLTLPVTTQLTQNESIGINAAHLTFLVSKLNTLSHENLRIPMAEREFIFGYVLSGLLGVLQNVKGDNPSLISFVNILSSRLGHIITCSIAIDSFMDMLIELLIETNAAIDNKKLIGELRISASNLRMLTNAFLETLTTNVYKQYHILLKCTNVVANLQRMLTSSADKAAQTTGTRVECSADIISLEMLLTQTASKDFSEIVRQLSAVLGQTEIDFNLAYVQLVYKALLAFNMSDISSEQKLSFLAKCEDQLLDHVSKHHVFRLLSAIVELGTYLYTDSITAASTPACQNILLLIALMNKEWILDYRLHQDCSLLLNIIDFLHVVLIKNPEILGALPKYAVRGIMALLCEASTSDIITDAKQNRILISLQSVYTFLAKALMSNTITNSFSQISNSSSSAVNLEYTNNILGCLTLFSASTIFDEEITAAAINIHSYIMDSEQTYDFLKVYTNPSNILQTLGIASSSSLLGSMSSSITSSITSSVASGSDTQGSPLCYSFTDGLSTAVPINAIVHVLQGIVDRKINMIIQASSFIFACAQINQKNAIIAAISRINSSIIVQLVEQLQQLADAIDIDSHKKSKFTEAVSDIFMKRDTAV